MLCIDILDGNEPEEGMPPTWVIWARIFSVVNSTTQTE